MVRLKSFRNSSRPFPIVWPFAGVRGWLVLVLFAGCSLRDLDDLGPGTSAMGNVGGTSQSSTGSQPTGGAALGGSVSFSQIGGNAPTETGGTTSLGGAGSVPIGGATLIGAAG